MFVLRFETAKRHVQELKESEWCGYRCLGDVLLSYWDFIISLHQIDCTEDLLLVECLCKILYVRDWIPIRYRSRIEPPVVSTGTSHVLSLLGTMCSGEDHGLLEGRIIPSRRSRSNSALAAFNLLGANLRGLLASGWPGVVCM